MASPQKPLRLIIVDQHQFVRRGIASVLTKHKVVAEAANGCDAIRLARQLKPDVVITDTKLTMMNVFLVTYEIVTELPETRVLINTDEILDSTIDRALHCGVSGYILKSQPIDELPKAVEVVGSGSIYFCPLVARRVKQNSKLPPSAKTFEGPLTKREESVLQLLSESHMNKGIASALGISNKTVEAHISNIGNKLGMHDRVSLTRYAISAGMSPL